MVTLYTRVLYLLTNILSVVAKKKAVIIFMVPITEIIAWICICPSKSYLMSMLKEHFTDDLDLAD
jgi:hypothetical protein